jgi:uncharacterized protein YdhG (YjbR/CyaY superfamily)
VVQLVGGFDYHVKANGRRTRQCQRNRSVRKVISIDEYIRRFPKSTRKVLRQMRRTIQAAAPGAEETIKYGIPTFRLNGNLVHFGGFEHHVSFFPTSSPMKPFKAELAKYETSRGTIRFPVDKPLPLSLIRKIVRFRVGQMVPPSPFAALAAPAQRALTRAGIATLKQLSRKSERQIAGLHGIGPSGLRKLRVILRSNGMRFRR